MEKDTLSEVIQVEKEIQKCLDLEQAKVREWIETARKTIEEEFILEEKKIQESLDKIMEEAAGTGAAQASEIIARAAAAAEKLACIKSEILSRIVEQQITKIVPGPANTTIVSRDLQSTGSSRFAP